MGRLEEAEALLAGIGISDNPFLSGITATNEGFLFLNKARYDLAVDYFKKALQYFQKANKYNSTETALCLSHLSFAYLSMGKLNQSLENGLLALQLRQQLYGDQNEIVAASYNDLGVVYSQLEADKAIDYYYKALAIYQKLHGKDHPKIAISNINLGVIYQQLKLYGDAITCFETAEKIWQKIYPSGHPNLAFALFNLGNTYNVMGDATTAIELFNKAIAIYKNTLGDKHPSISTVYNQLGFVYLNKNLYEKALASAQAAFYSNVPSFNSQAIEATPSIKEFYNGKVFLYSLQLKAEALEARHFGKSLKFEDLKTALSLLLKADSLLDIIRQSSDDEADKIALGAIGSDIYEDGVNLALAMSELAMAPKKYREVAFYFAEKSKSAVLEESIADSEAKSFAGIPDTLLNIEKELKSSLAAMVQKLAQKPAIEEEGKLRQRLFALNEAIEAFKQKLEREYPDYFKLKFDNKKPTLSAIQQRLDQSTALVSYFIAEKRKKIIRFVIAKNNFKISVSSLPDSFNRLIAGFRNSILFNESKVYEATANKLSKALIASLPRNIKNLVIIPTGIVSSVPFEALLYRRAVNESSEKAPYLIKKYAISYELSVGIFIQKNKAVQAKQEPSLFLCAPIRFSTERGLDDLPGSQSEVNSIAALFSKDKTQLVTYKDASEEIVKSRQLKNYNYLHFATHGIVDEESPELSRIFLNESAKEDGNLFSGEIYNLSLMAELAVLSACQTGLGKVYKGEGVIGLSRALTFAGVKNIIVSFWRVNDQSTALLMTDFYNNVLTTPNNSFNAALRKAKLTMIKNQEYASPYYWAPFILIGQ